MQLVQSPKVSPSKPSTSKTTPDLSSSSSPKTTKGVMTSTGQLAGKDADSDMYQDMPKLVGVVLKKRHASDSESVPPPSSGEGSPGAVIREEEARRLCSETRRILLGHQEHAMTLTELAEHFCSEGDPATPTSDSLYGVLKKQSAGDGGATAATEKFEVCA